MHNISLLECQMQFSCSDYKYINLPIIIIYGRNFPVYNQV